MAASCHHSSIRRHGGGAHAATRRGASRLRPLLFLLCLAMLAGGALTIFNKLEARSETYRLEEIEAIISEKACLHNLEENLVKAVIWKESRFRPNIVGGKGEIGLMQITNGAVEDWARITHNPKPSRNELFTPSVNIEIGAWYLARAGRYWADYASRDILQLAEYNAGRRNVESLWKPNDKNTHLSLDSISFPGTQDYIKQILEKKRQYDLEDHAKNDVTTIQAD